MSRRTGWSLVLALVFGAVAVVIAAAVWGGTPVRQIPLVVISMLVGAFLPAATDKAIRRDVAAAAAHPPANSGPSISQVVTSSPVHRFVCEIPPMNRARGITALIFSIVGLAIGLTTVVFALQWSPTNAEDADFREGIFGCGPTLCAFSLWLLSGIIDIPGGRIVIVIEEDGVVLTDHRDSVKIPWLEIDRIWYHSKTGYVRVSAPKITKGDHDRIYRMLGKGAERARRRVRWDPNSPKIDLCKVSGLATSTALFYDAMERASGRRVENR
jgi:hypothetical protein